jgi:hypothetical protein
LFYFFLIPQKLCFFFFFFPPPPPIIVWTSVGTKEQAGQLACLLHFTHVISDNNPGISNE